jgi:hypothetical protein
VAAGRPAIIQRYCWACVLSTLAAGHYVITSHFRSFAALGKRLRSIPEPQREKIADDAFEAGWRSVRSLIRSPILRVALLRFDIALLNHIVFQWNPMLTLIGFVVGVVSLVLSIVGLRLM